MFAGDGAFGAPAFPLETVIDPTGAGDSFAGGFMGTLAATGDTSHRRLAARLSSSAPSWGRSRCKTSARIGSSRSRRKT